VAEWIAPYYQPVLPVEPLLDSAGSNLLSNTSIKGWGRSVLLGSDGASQSFVKRYNNQRLGTADPFLAPSRPGIPAGRPASEFLHIPTLRLGDGREPFGPLRRRAWLDIELPALPSPYRGVRGARASIFVQRLKQGRGIAVMVRQLVMRNIIMVTSRPPTLLWLPNQVWPDDPWTAAAQACAVACRMQN